jgi:hypothetical protein
MQNLMITEEDTTALPEPVATAVEPKTEAAAPAADAVEPKADPQPETSIKRKRKFRQKMKVWMPVSECIATCEFITKSGNWIPVAIWDMTESGRVFLAFITKEAKKIKYNNKIYNEKFAYHETGTWYVDANSVDEKLRFIS